jgi:hypothetical protein
MLEKGDIITAYRNNANKTGVLEEYGYEFNSKLDTNEEMYYIRFRNITLD